MNIRAVGAELF